MLVLLPASIKARLLRQFMTTNQDALPVLIAKEIETLEGLAKRPMTDGERMAFEIAYRAGYAAALLEAPSMTRVAFDLAYWPGKRDD